MKSLIWKEVRQQLVWFLVALSLAAQMWFGMANVWDQLVRATNETALWSLAYPLLYACALAQLQFGRDGDSRRFGLLVHRQQGARGYFTSKVAVGIGALTCVVVLPVTIWTLAMSLSDPDAALIRWVRVPQACLFCVPALLVYAIGVLSTQLRRGALVRWGIAFGGVFGALLVVWPLAMIMGPGRIWVYAWIGTDVLLALAVLWLARSLLLGGRDRDLPLRDLQLAGLAVVGFLLLLPPASFLLGTAESAALRVIVEEKPAILHDSTTDELLVAERTEDGWRRRGNGQEITNQSNERFFLGAEHMLDLVHHAGSNTVEGAKEAREYIAEVSRCRSISDSAPRGHVNYGASPTSDEHWLVQVELMDTDGAVHIDASRRGDGLPPLKLTVARPDGKFSSQAGFLEFRPHSPLVLDRADGTLWRIELEQEGAHVVPLELPGGDRVSALEPLFQREPALLGRFEQRFWGSEESSSGYLFVGRGGSYVLLDDKLVPFSETSRPKETVTADEAARLARYAVVSTWPDAFTEVIRVEQLPGHETLLELTAEPRTRAARASAMIYGSLAFLRAPASVLQESFSGRKLTSGRISAPIPKEMQLFAHGGHPLLFALLMLCGAFQLFLGWRWLARGGVGIPTRVVYVLLILVGGVVALGLTRLLLPRGLPSAGAREKLSWTGDSPRPLHASSPRS